MFNPGGVWLAWLALPVSALTVWLLSRGRAARIALDHPNQRSLHATPIPRTGGLGVVAGVATGWAILGMLGGILPIAAWASAALLAGLSFADDRYGLPTGMRFLFHIAAAIWVVATLETGWDLWLWPLTVIAIVWMTNLYNFMDGSDGLAGGMAFFGFGCYALAAVIQQDTDLALASMVIAAASAGFLLFNFPPARVFMGDTGSIPLGFLAAGLGLIGAADNVWPIWFPALVFLPFIVDATVTLLRRGVRGERVWLAHNEHYYQRLIRMGWSHRRTALAEYALIAGSSGIALITLHITALESLWLVILWCMLMMALMWRVDSRWRHFQENKKIST